MSEQPDVLDFPDVLDVVVRVRAACRDHDGHDPLDEAAVLRLKHHGLDGVAAWVAEDGRGFALRRGPELDLAVHPEARGHGVGGDLAGRALAADDARPVSAWSHGDHPAAARLAARHDLARARELWVMRRPAGRELPELVLPDGVRVRGYRDGDADAVIAVNGAAFAAHPEQGGMDAEAMAERMAEPWWNPAGLLLAEDEDGRLLGFHWTKVHGAGLGEVYVVGVSPAAQGRGLGRVLTLAGLHHLAGAGVEEVLLYVESDNTPAVRLYGGLGFAHAAADTHVQYRG